jgi:hypothetical protein
LKSFPSEQKRIFFYNDDEIQKRTSSLGLKRYCRQKYKENPWLLTKPPKNSCSKQEFIEWAQQNGIELSQFKTRGYRRRTHECVPQQQYQHQQQQQQLVQSSQSVPVEIPFNYNTQLQYPSPSPSPSPSPPLQQTPTTSQIQPFVIRFQTSQESESVSNSSDDISEVEECVIQTLTSMSN